MEFRLLGPVEMWLDGRRVDAGRRLQRALLAALLVDVGRVVSDDTLMDRVWGEAAPEGVRTSLRVYVSRLRRLLEQSGSATALSRASGGYVLQVDPDQIDLHRFRRLAGSTGSADAPVESLRAALALWQGQPLAGIEGEWARRMRETWVQERLDATVVWARAELAQGNPRAVLTGLPELASENPLVEPLTEVLMRALHAAARTSEALDLYARTRAHLAEELGTDPGPDLQRLHQSLLRGEVEAAFPSVRQVPRELPAVAPLFIGRVVELAELGKIHDASTVVITAIDGMAGVGKTALAVLAGHQLAHRYPDGQLFLDLHGYTEGVAPVEPGAALERMLRSLGVPADRIPADVEQRAASYRSRLADQRMVIVLDNAASETQVQPLLPGAPGCVVLVTSRRRLAGLDHTHTLSVDILPLPDAVALLGQTAGEHRLTGESPDLVTELVELCGRLPLAIRISAARLRSHPAWDLAHLASRLRDQRHRLAELEAGQRSVIAALDLSYVDLVADQQRTYRILGLHPGPDIDSYAAAALLDTTLPRAGRMLEHLLEAHLLQEPTPGRYRFHDLVRAHAAHTAARHENLEDGQRALDRLLDHYRHTAAVAMDTAYPYVRPHSPQVPPALTPGPALSDATQGTDWMDSELRNLLAAAWYAAEHDRPEHLLHLSSIVHWHLRMRGHHHEAEALHQRALATARATGQPAAELDALTALGHIHRLQGRYDQATDLLERATRLGKITGDRGVELDALTALGHIHRLQGRYDRATEHYEEALRLTRDTSHHAAELEALTGLGFVHTQQNRYEPAADYLEQALRLARDTGQRTSEVQALTGISNVRQRQGRYEEAAEHLELALRLARDLGNRNGEGNTLNSLGHLHRALGRYAESADFHEQALRLGRELGHRTTALVALSCLGITHRSQGLYERAAEDFQQLLDLATEADSRNFQFEAWQGLGRLRQDAGVPAAALTYHRQALVLAVELGQPEDQARAHDGIAHAAYALHQPEQARTHWQQALDILVGRGRDHAEDKETTVAAIRAHLANLEDDAVAPRPPS